MPTSKPAVLVTAATGRIGGSVVRSLAEDDSISLVAGVRSAAKAQALADQGIRSVLLDFDKPQTLGPALAGIDRVFLATGYSVDMLRQSKEFLDAAKKAGVRHVAHLGACGPDDTSVAHWAWHQLVERYIEWSGFSFTHLRPEAFMQNLLHYDGTQATHRGVVRQFIGDARISWVDGDDVALVASRALLQPQLHAGQTYRLGYDAKSYAEVAAIMTAVLGQPFRYEAQPPEVFLEEMRAAGAEMAYMACVYDSFKRTASGAIPGVDQTFDNFAAITGRQPVKWEEFVRKHRTALAY
ncbi:SDR family oxidoreductase [Comamonas antarctica]|uniref:SDR family oxidoreductase n=1 Tax=Comamonas antarctica TaxID=2743470 RepID=A0A6N1XBZ5_9BURK|nr:SDR family oxidoreductase [Comamonas antarctica]QKV55336.1 SDR family oxidoreductase [Comamonas antarctica]